MIKIDKIDIDNINKMTKFKAYAIKHKEVDVYLNHVNVEDSLENALLFHFEDEAQEYLEYLGDKDFIVKEVFT